MEDSLLQQGLDITLFGMGIVFSFLLVLVIATGFMSRIVTRSFPEPEDAPPLSNPQSDSDRLKAIVRAAIEQHRNRNKR
ncbi:OadG family protein [Microbulbifer discodermiae]|uniref:OadG family protein n=1 Tax=Microbulbifer sp. 2201CG32-9 TaxID=3232309 RepID=UPI00345BC3D9